MLVNEGTPDSSWKGRGRRRQLLLSKNMKVRLQLGSKMRWPGLPGNVISGPVRPRNEPRNRSSGVHSR